MYSKQGERKNIKTTLTADEARRKREEKHNSLRKQKKNEVLTKRRRENTGGAVHDPQILEKVPYFRTRINFF